MRVPASHLLALAVVAACAPSKLPPPSPHDPAAREAMLLTAHDLAPGRHCRIVDPGVPLPDVTTVIDTAAMPEYLHQVGVAADTGYAVFSLRYDSTGGPVRARLIEATFPDSLARQLELAVASAIVPRAGGGRLAGRLRVDLAPAPTYRLGRSEYCEPETMAQRGTSLRSTAQPKESPVRGSVTVYKYVVDVSPQGNAEAVHFLTAIDAELESTLRSSIMREQWQPALDDGVPVAGHATSTISIGTRVVGRPVGGP